MEIRKTVIIKETIEADGLGEPQPQLQPTLARAFATLLAYMVVYALDPLAPKRRLLGLRENEPVLDGDARLVVVAVAHPDPQLLPGESAVVHAQVEGMEVVVALVQDAPEARLELRGAHTSSSIPSLEISTTNVSVSGPPPVLFENQRA